MLVLDRNGETGLVLPADVCGEGVLVTGLEFQLESLSFGCRGGEGYIDLYIGVVDVRGKVQ